MWQLYSLLGLFTNAFENSIDKFAVIKGEDLDSMIMTFHRVAIYTIIIIIVGLFGITGKVELCLDWKIILFGIFSIVNSLLYTYVLGKIEVTSIATISYLGPIGFLLIDVFFINVHLSWMQILGILLLVLGGIGFSIEGNTKKLKKEISLKILGVFLFWIIYGGVEGYLFKFMNSIQGVNATTFFSNVWAWSTLALFVIVLFQRKSKLLFTKSAGRYATKSIISKGCDVGTTLFASQALILASVSQVSSMSALEPLVLFVVTIIFQGLFKLHINERLDRMNFLWKSGMVILLVTGGFLVR